MIVLCGIPGCRPFDCCDNRCGPIGLRTDDRGLRLGAGLARKGWLTKADVINTLPLEKLRLELAKKRQVK